MPHYLETAADLNKQVEKFIGVFIDKNEHAQAAVELAHIINRAVLCNPRKPQGIVRKRIVQTAMGNRCTVTMIREPYERRDGTMSTYNKIHINPR